jgi:hypothetical protein
LKRPAEAPHAGPERQSNEAAQRDVVDEDSDHRAQGQAKTDH